MQLYPILEDFDLKQSMYAKDYNQARQNCIGSQNH